MSSVALFAEEGRVPITVIPITGNPYKALWVGVAVIHDMRFHLIVDMDGTVAWIDEPPNRIQTMVRYDPAVEDWVEPNG